MELGRGALEDLVVEPDFWRSKRVFVTGHSGFKGSWLCLWLQTAGAEPVGYSASLPSSPALFDLARVGEEMVSIDGDIRDFDHLRRSLSEHRPEIVIHMAAQPLVRRSYRHPRETYETNVMGAVNLLEAVRQADHVRAAINVTTDKVYENRELERGYREDEPKGGFDPYSNSKACSDLITSAYRDSFFGTGADDGRRTALASARAGNVIGGGDWGEDRLVPDIMRCALERQSLVIRNPGAVRPWQHILNPLSGYLQLAQSLWESDQHADAWNFGPPESDARPVRWILERLEQMWGEEIRWEHDGGTGPHETRYLKLDSSKARSLLGWVPKWDLESGLRSIVDWYRALKEGDDLREVSVDQIRAYQDTSLPAGENTPSRAAGP